MEIQSQRVAAMQTVSVQGNSAATVKTGGVASAAPTVPAAAPSTVDRKKLEEAIRSMDAQINVTQPPQLAFSIDDKTEQIVVRVTDASTGELIRQLPSEDALKIAQSLDQMRGLLLKQQA